MRTRRVERTIKVLLFSVIVGTLLFSASMMRAQVTRWFVWEKIFPCQDTRQDWFTVAQTYPGESISTNMWDIAATAGPFSTFAEAMTAADTAKMGSNFSNRCCKDWGVWEDIRTNKLSVIRSTAIFAIPEGKRIVRGGLCCEEAFEQAGLPVGAIRDCRNLQLSTGATVTLLPNGTFGPASAAGAGTGTGAPSPGIGGTWTSPTGDTIQLTQNGNKITGTYRGALGTGEITGTFDGKNLSGTFRPSQALIPLGIPFTLTLLEDGKLVGRLETPLGNNPLTLTRPGGIGTPPSQGAGGGSGGQEIDLSGRWRAKQFQPNVQCDSESEWVLSRVAADKWQGPATQACYQRPNGTPNPSLSSSGQVTLQITGPGKVRITYKFKFIGTSPADTTQEADGTYTNSEITIGDPSQGPPLRYTRR